MKIKIFFLLLLFIGCMDTEENASINLKKGDTFFEKKEYEVAEYYYERIPEDSPLYRKAEKKLEEIAAIKKQWVEKDVPASEVAKILIIDHTYKLDNVSHVPMHRLSLVNNTARILEYIEVEFTYFDKAKKPVAVLSTEVRTPMFQNTQDVFTGIEPGALDKEFVSATAKIIRARFQ